MNVSSTCISTHSSTLTQKILSSHHQDNFCKNSEMILNTLVMFKYKDGSNFYITVTWNESDFVTQADINIYEERITFNQKMRTKLTLEQKRWILDIIGGLNRYLKTKAGNFYRYDFFIGYVHYFDENSRL